jgi:hypothetical protein
MSKIEQDDPRLVFMKEEDVLNATGFCQIIKDRWFVVHPETRSLVFYQSETKRRGKLVGASPQCNASENTAKYIKDKMFPWAELKFFERVACPIDLKDYA